MAISRSDPSKPSGPEPPDLSDAALDALIGDTATPRHARGMTVREIQGHLEQLYQVEVSPAMISTVTDAVLDEVST